LKRKKLQLVTEGQNEPEVVYKKLAYLLRKIPVDDLGAVYNAIALTTEGDKCH
jgi:hypothetical protein